MDILETETFRRARERLLSKREYQFIQRQILHPTRVIPKLRRSGGIRKLIWVGTIKGRRRKMQILYYYRNVGPPAGARADRNRPTNRSVVEEPGGVTISRLIRPLRRGSGEGRERESGQGHGRYQITMLYVCQLRDSEAMSQEQARDLRTAIREQTRP